MRFDLQSFDQAVMNSSGELDYYKNNARLHTASQISGERQVRPTALNHAPPDELIVDPAPRAVMPFSGAPPHSSVANRSGRARFDFRTVDVADVHAGRGAPMVDVDCTGTAIRDFRRVADEAPFDEGTVPRLLRALRPGSTLVFTPPTMDALHAS